VILFCEEYENIVPYAFEEDRREAAAVVKRCFEWETETKI